MRRRNPDEQAYRAWQADRSDRVALQRYLFLMARDRKVLDDPELIVELDELVEQHKEFRPIYEHIRPDYSDEYTPFELKNWIFVVGRYVRSIAFTVRKIDPRVVKILVEMGLRSGLSMRDVYRRLKNRRLIPDEIYKAISSIGSSSLYGREYYACVLRDAKLSAASAIPQLVCCIKNDTNDDLRSLCIDALGEICKYPGMYTSAVPLMIRHSIEDEYSDVRYYCARNLGKFGANAVSAVSALEDLFKREVHDSIRYNCVKSLGEIGPSSSPALPTLVDALGKSQSGLVRSGCVMAIVKIGIITEEVIDLLIDVLKSDIDLKVRYSCIDAIKESKITDENVVFALSDSVINDAEYTIRFRCAMALARMGSLAIQSLDQLNFAFRNDKEYVVREACCAAIKKITGEAPK